MTKPTELWKDNTETPKNQHEIIYCVNEKVGSIYPALFKDGMIETMYGRTREISVCEKWCYFDDLIQSYTEMTATIARQAQQLERYQNALIRVMRMSRLSRYSCAQRCCSIAKHALPNEIVISEIGNKGGTDGE